MRIFFVTGEFPPMQGGVGDYTREIGLALAELGCEVHVLTLQQGGPVPGLTVHPVIQRWNWGCYRPILSRVRRHRPDVVHVQYQAAAYRMHPAINFAPWILHRLGADRPLTAVTFHDLRVPYLFPKAGPVRRWVVNSLARSSDMAITTNQEDLERLQKVLGTPPALIPIGSNIAPSLPAGFDRDSWRAHLGIDPGDLLLGFFGFINARKGVEALLHAVAMLVADPETSLCPRILMIGGKTGASDPTNVAYLMRIEALVDELGLENHIVWTGFLPSEEVTACFKATDFCVLPFRDGVSFLHGTFHAALAHGVPIITTFPRVNLPELVDGENICLVPPDQPQALAQAIADLATQPQLQHRLAAGAETLSEQFRWENIASSTLELYRAAGLSS